MVRPALGYLALLGTGPTAAERLVIAGFGIRGIGSLFYLAYALQHGTFADPAQLWAITAFTVLLSVAVHGILSTPVMHWLDRRFGRPTEASETMTDQAATPEDSAAQTAQTD